MYVGINVSPVPAHKPVQGESFLVLTGKYPKFHQMLKANNCDLNWIQWIELKVVNISRKIYMIKEKQMEILELKNELSEVLKFQLTG